MNEALNEVLPTASAGCGLIGGFALIVTVRSFDKKTPGDGNARQ